MSGEFSFIQALRSFATHEAARNLQDDCAILPFGNETLILTHDAMAAGIHFLPEQDPADIAWKLVSSNVSDLAAKGAEPLGVLLGYTLRSSAEDLRFLEGLKDALQFYEIALLGGDTIGSVAQQTLGLTALGRATHTPVPSRTGAKPGDTLYITGPVGASMLGLEILRTNPRDTSSDTLAYRRGQALVPEGITLAPLVTSMMDVSDGVLLDTQRIAEASGVSIHIDACAVPIATPEDRRAEALSWGEDYQLLFTAEATGKMPVNSHPIGIVSKFQSKSLFINGLDTNMGLSLGYSHNGSID